MKALQIVLALAGAFSPLSAQAGDWVLGIGNGIETNDPFLKSPFSPELSVDYRPFKYFGLTSMVGVRPNLSRKSWSPLTRQLVGEMQISPALSRVLIDTRLGLKFIPAHAKVGRNGQANFGVQIGMGMVHSVDDLEALQCEEDPQCMATERQWHLSTFYGIAGEVLWHDRLGLRFRAERVRHIETTFSTALQIKGRHMVSADFLVKL